MSWCSLSNAKITKQGILPFFKYFGNFPLIQKAKIHNYKYKVLFIKKARGFAPLVLLFWATKLGLITLIKFLFHHHMIIIFCSL